MLGWIARGLLIVAGSVASWFVAKDAPQFGLMQMAVGLIHPRRRWPRIAVLLLMLLGAVGTMYWWKQHQAQLPASIVWSNGRIDSDEIDIDTKCAGRIADIFAGEGDMVVQTKAERRENDALQACHWTISLLKRWLLGTHAGAVREKHLQAYLDEFA